MPLPDPTSSFLPPSSAEAGATFTELSVLPSRGFNELVKAKRYGRWWVLKGLKPAYRNQTVYRLLLRKEYDLLSQLSHPHVVMVHSVEEVEGLGLCIVMEWIDGQNLTRWLAQGGHPRRERLAVARQLMDALAYIHARQIVHRDLKPSNIMVAANGNVVKLIDFGLADSDSYALFKQSAGSDGYLSPEQRAGGKPDVRNDLYSLGCVLSDLRLGWTARGVIRRCRRPLAARYPNVAAVRRAFDRSRRIPYLLVLVTLVLLLLAALAFHARLTTPMPIETTREAAPAPTPAADTLLPIASSQTLPEAAVPQPSATEVPPPTKKSSARPSPKASPSSTSASRPSTARSASAPTRSPASVTSKPTISRPSTPSMPSWPPMPTPSRRSSSSPMPSRPSTASSSSTPANAITSLGPASLSPFPNKTSVAARPLRPSTHGIANSEVALLRMKDPNVHCRVPNAARILQTTVRFL